VATLNSNQRVLMITLDCANCRHGQPCAEWQVGRADRCAHELEAPVVAKELIDLGVMRVRLESVPVGCGGVAA